MTKQGSSSGWGWRAPASDFGYFVCDSWSQNRECPPWNLRDVCCVHETLLRRPGMSQHLTWGDDPSWHNPAERSVAVLGVKRGLKSCSELSELSLALWLVWQKKHHVSTSREHIHIPLSAKSPEEAINLTGYQAWLPHYNKTRTICVGFTYKSIG